MNSEENQKALKARFLFAVRTTVKAVTHMLEDTAIFPGFTEDQKSAVFETVINGWLSALPPKLAAEVHTEVFERLILNALEHDVEQPINEIETHANLHSLFAQVGWQNEP